jgi:hypothetical protein
MVAKNVAELLNDHVTLEVESIDRMYLNGYVPAVQTPLGFIGFVKRQLGMPIASTAAVSGMSRAFLKQIDTFVDQQSLEVVNFEKGQRKDDIAQARLAKFTGNEGVLFVGKAQEKASVFRTAKRRSESSGKVYPWIYRGSTVTNPVRRDNQRGPALRYGDPRVMALMSALCLFFNLPDGFRNSDLQVNVAQLLGLDPASYKPGRMTYDLRRLRLHGLIMRIPHSYRYLLTDLGIRVAALFTKSHARILRTCLSIQSSADQTHDPPPRTTRGLKALQKGIDLVIQEACLAS